MRTPVKISEILAKAHEEGRSNLLEPEVYEIFRSEGLNTPNFVFFRNPVNPEKAAGEAFASLKGGRAVIKTVSHKNLHKSDSGGVKIIENSPGELKKSISEMAKKFPGADGIMAAEFIEHSAASLGEEIMLGARADDAFGPVISFGPGGTATEDMSKSLKPELVPDIMAVGTVNNRKDWEEFLANSWIWKYVSGKARGRKKLAEDGEMIKWLEIFAHIMKRYSADDSPDWEIVEFEVNPLAVSKGAIYPLDGVLRFRKARKIKRNEPSLAGVRSILAPKRIGIVGVSEKKTNMARIILRNVVSAGFPRENISIIKDYDGEIEGVKCVRRTADLPARLDMYVVAVPSPAVPEVLKEAAESGKVNGVVLISGGMGEKSGSENMAENVKNIIAEGRRKNPDFALSGGNSLGMVLRESKVNTLFIPEYKMAYPLRENPNIAKTAFVSQSGAFVISALSKMPWLRPHYSITVGNQQDITVPDYVRAVMEEKEIKVILVYMEGFKPYDGLKLAALARKARKAGKQMIIYKAGRTAAGQKAVMGHTASIAGDYIVSKKVLEKAGAMVADTFDDFSDFALLSCHMAGYGIKNNKVFLISNAGFETAGMADNIGENLSTEINEEKLRGPVEAILKKHRLDSIVDFKNPMDVTPMATDSAVFEIIREILNHSTAGAAIVSMIPLTAALNTLPKSGGYPDDINKSFLENAAAEAKKAGKPLIFCVACGTLYEPYVEHAMNLGIPTFRSADRAVKVYSRYIKAFLSSGA